VVVGRTLRLSLLQILVRWLGWWIQASLISMGADPTLHE
jgi:hypothetical protein